MMLTILACLFLGFFVTLGMLAVAAAMVWEGP